MIGMIRPRPGRVRWQPLLRPLARVYGWVIDTRNRRFDGASASVAVDVPVISVGNITVGGTGKTPLVLELVTRLLGRGRKPAILTRGYGAKHGATADEVQEFQAQQPSVPVVVNPKRVQGAQTAIAEHGADVLVMDDGFQHRRLRRDLDLVLIDAWNPWGGELLLPAGRLREPLTSLRRAGVICLSRANQVDARQCAAIREKLAEVAPGVPTIASYVEPRDVAGLDGHIYEREALAKLRLQPVCGLGNPLTFARLCQDLSPVVRTPLMFPDHYNYTRQDAETILKASVDRGADLIVTTRKDWGKLTAVWPQEAALPLARAEMAVRVVDDAGVLEAALNDVLEKNT